MTVDNDPQREETVVEGEAVELPSDPGPAAAGPPPIAPAPVYEPEPYSARAPASAAASAAPGSGWPDAGIDFSERPEYLVGAAFGGGLLLALILRKLGR